MYFFFFFFKQKTAYEITYGDWSSDVCSSDLDHLALQRVLAGYAKHPNVAAYILIGLGCEVNQAAVMLDKQRMAAPGHPERKPLIINIQEAGGIRKTVERAAAEVAKLLPVANA